MWRIWGPLYNLNRAILDYRFDMDSKKKTKGDGEGDDDDADDNEVDVKVSNNSVTIFKILF